MGACAAAGGAASSGKGIYPEELAHCIREAARKGGDQGHPSSVSSFLREASNAGSVDHNQISENVPPVSPQLRRFEFVDADYKEEKVFTADKIQYKDEEGTINESTPKVTSYAPKIFEHLRWLEGITQDNFLSEWTLSSDKCVTALGEGRSMAYFMKSEHQNYMAKTIAQAEVDVLLAILKQYDEYLSLNQHSLLMRFNMLIKIEVRAEVGFLLIFSDVFATCPAINELWDLKGRHPKPGKFLHLPSKKDYAVAEKKYDSMAQRDAQQREQQAHEPASSRPLSPQKPQDSEAGEAAAALDKPQKSLLQEDMHPERRAAFKVDGSAGQAKQGKIRVRKDKELTRLFWLEEEDRDALVKQLNADFKLLTDAGLMDYSILIGVQYNYEGKLPSMRHTAHFDPMSPAIEQKRPWVPPKHSPRHTMGEAASAQASGPASGHASPPSEAAGFGAEVGSFCDDASSPSRCKYHEGVESVLGEETYYIGIIDMLTLYSGKKKVANFCKTFLWEPETLSTIPPEEYRNRISEFMDLIFASA